MMDSSALFCSVLVCCSRMHVCCSGNTKTTSSLPRWAEDEVQLWTCEYPYSVLYCPWCHCKVFKLHSISLTTYTSNGRRIVEPVGLDQRRLKYN